MAEKDEKKTTADHDFRASELLSGDTSRRDFVKVAGSLGVAGLGVFGGVRVLGTKATDATVYAPKAKMMIVHDPSRCVGCRRCEIACSLFHDDKICLSTARIKLSRNYNFGPEGPRVGWTNGQGMFGNHRLIAETCLQCPHPIPCATSCPQQAIGVDAKTGARVIDKKKCVGCGICEFRCPVPKQAAIRVYAR